MSNIYQVILDFHAGCHIDDAIREACAMADLLSAPVVLLFNGTKLNVRGGSDQKEVQCAYWRMRG